MSCVDDYFIAYKITYAICNFCFPASAKAFLDCGHITCGHIALIDGEQEIEPDLQLIQKKRKQIKARIRNVVSLFVCLYFFPGKFILVPFPAPRKQVLSL